MTHHRMLLRSARRGANERHHPPRLPGRRRRRRPQVHRRQGPRRSSSTTGPTFDSASVFTGNRCKANPILWSQEVVKDGIVKAVVLNSGGANCYTGAYGFQTTHAVAETGRPSGLGIGAVDVVVCSTGLIGLANDRDEAARRRRGGVARR